MSMSKYASKEDYDKAHKVTPTVSAEREAFEKWMSDDGLSPKAVRRDGDGYALMQASMSWIAWQAGRAALLAEIKAGGPFTYAYRYEVGITMRVRNHDPLEVVHLYRLPEGE